MATVPAEFRGEARVFRNAVVSADARVTAALPNIIAPLRRRLARKPSLRPEMMLSVTRAWEGAITDPLTLRPLLRVERDEFALGELRVCAARCCNDFWADREWEQAVSLVWNVVVVRRGQLRLIVRPAAALLLHALARRFERGEGHTAEDVLRDLRLLARALDDAADSVPVPGGRWVGAWRAVHDDAERRNVRLYHCQTFLN